MKAGKEIGRGNLHSIFTELAATLASQEPGRTWGILICGGAAMIALGLRSTNTRDIDVVEPELDESLKRAADRQEDLEDLVSLSPSEEELADAAKLVVTYDLNPAWPEHVDRTVAKVLRALAKKA